MDIERGQIISFYSFKGGVGRTMALANVARILAERTATANTGRRRVLVIDWDLESPGLHYYMHDEGLSAACQGLVQMILALQLPDCIDTTLDESKQVRELRQRIEQLPLSDYFHEVPDSSGNVDLWFMPHSGGSLEQYLNDVHRVPWTSIDHAAPWAIPIIIESLSMMFDFVLLDSRTGIADISFVCAQVPDKMVFVFNSNRQSVRGSRIYFDKVLPLRRENALKGHGSDLAVFPLLSLSQEGIPAEVHNWIRNPTYGAEHFIQDMFPTPSDFSWYEYLSTYHIPYVASLAFGEQMCVRHASVEKYGVSSRFRAFADLLANSTTAHGARTTESDITTKKQQEHKQKLPELVSLSEAAQYLGSVITSLDVVDRIGTNNVTQMRAVTDALGRDELGNSIVKICRYYLATAESAQDADDRWASIWFKYARDILQETENGLYQLTCRLLPDGFSQMDHGFWSTSLWSAASKWIWTTNVAGVGQSFGRQLDIAAIEQQGKTVARGIPVSRVFVLEDNATVEDREELAKIIKHQVEAGITAFAIGRDRFDTAKGRAEDEFGSDDFMIVDDEFVYVTERHQQNGGQGHSRARRIRIIKSPSQLLVANTLRRQIESAACLIQSADEVDEVLAEEYGG